VTLHLAHFAVVGVANMCFICLKYVIAHTKNLSSCSEIFCLNRDPPTFHSRWRRSFSV